MSILEDEIQEIAKFEPLLMSLLEPAINVQEARILALIFKNGGYMPLNTISKIIGIAQPTVSNRVSELSDKKFLRKNDELMPIALVLTISVPEIRNFLNSKINKLNLAKEFLSQSIQNGLISNHSITDMMIKALDHFFLGEEPIGQILTLIFKNPFISRQTLYNEIIGVDKSNKKLIENLDSLIEKHLDYIQPIYKKFQKNEIFFNTCTTLENLIESRFLYLSRIHRQYNMLIDELDDFLTQDYNSLLPIQLLPYPSDLKLRIDTCLKKYSKIRIIFNNIYQKSGKKDSVIDQILNSKELTNEHEIKLFKGHEIQAKANWNIKQIKHQAITFKIDYDFLTRDLILFKNHGCIVIPHSQHNSPYYNISPRFIKTITEIFEIHWK